MTIYFLVGEFEVVTTLNLSDVLNTR